MEPISSAVAVERAPERIAITDVPEAAALVSTMKRYRLNGKFYYDTLILSGEYDGTGWQNSTGFAAMLVHQLVVRALQTGTALPEGGERE